METISYLLSDFTFFIIMCGVLTDSHTFRKVILCFAFSNKKDVFSFIFYQSCQETCGPFSCLSLSKYFCQKMLKNTHHWDADLNNFRIHGKRQNRQNQKTKNQLLHISCDKVSSPDFSIKLPTQLRKTLD